ncbi:MAG TPA: tetratricopeptide repeat protein [Bacteroidota bacterium]|nr:tetratricopeptide repeat protein [Bacteroidota bacterium]
MIRFGTLIVCAAVVLAGCGKPSAREYFTHGEQEAQKATRIADSLRSAEAVREAFKPALELLGSVVSEYPGDSLADSALFMIASIRNTNLHMPAEAIEGYREYCRRYPDGRQAPMAMFLMGYLYNNDLHNTDSAEAAYRRFLDKYPGSEMARSAEFELKTLGRSPDEILAPASPAPPPPGKHVVKRASAKTRPGAGT